MSKMPGLGCLIPLVILNFRLKERFQDAMTLCHSSRLWVLNQCAILFPFFRVLFSLSLASFPGFVLILKAEEHGEMSQCHLGWTNDSSEFHFYFLPFCFVLFVGWLVFFGCFICLYELYHNLFVSSLN